MEKKAIVSNSFKNANKVIELEAKVKELETELKVISEAFKTVEIENRIYKNMISIKETKPVVEISIPVIMEPTDDIPVIMEPKPEKDEAKKVKKEKVKV